MLPPTQQQEPRGDFVDPCHPGPSHPPSKGAVPQMSGRSDQNCGETKASEVSRRQALQFMKRAGASVAAGILAMGLSTLRIGSDASLRVYPERTRTAAVLLVGVATLAGAYLAFKKLMPNEKQGDGDDILSRSTWRKPVWLGTGIILIGVPLLVTILCGILGAGVHRFTITGDTQELMKAANDPANPQRGLCIHMQYGEESHVYIRGGRLDQVLERLRAQGFEVERDE